VSEHAIVQQCRSTL